MGEFLIVFIEYVIITFSIVAASFLTLSAAFFIERKVSERYSEDLGGTVFVITIVLFLSLVLAMLNTITGGAPI